MNLLALATVIIQMNDDGVATAASVRLEEPPEGFEWVACIQEFAAPAIRCYAIEKETLELGFQDFTVKTP